MGDISAGNYAYSRVFNLNVQDLNGDLYGKRAGQEAIDFGVSKLNDRVEVFESFSIQAESKGDYTSAEQYAKSSAFYGTVAGVAQRLPEESRDNFVKEFFDQDGDGLYTDKDINAMDMTDLTTGQKDGQIDENEMLTKLLWAAEDSTPGFDSNNQDIQKDFKLDIAQNRKFDVYGDYAPYQTE